MINISTYFPWVGDFSTWLIDLATGLNWHLRKSMTLNSKAFSHTGIAYQIFIQALVLHIKSHIGVKWNQNY